MAAEAIIAGIAIIGQLETIYMVIDNIYQYQQKVCRLKDTCREFAEFVKEIETVLKARASHLTREEMFSVDAKKQLDKLEEILRCAAILLSNLESPYKVAAYTGVAANKIQELRGQILESVTLLTFHMVCSAGQPFHLRDPPDRPLRRNATSHFEDPSNRPLPRTPRRQSHEHSVHLSDSGSSSSSHPHSPTHQHSTITSKPMAENSTHHNPHYPQQSRPMSKMASDTSADNLTHHTHQSKTDSKLPSHSVTRRPSSHHSEIHHTGTGSTSTSHSHSGHMSNNPVDNHHQRASSMLASHGPAERPIRHHSDDDTRAGSGSRSRISAYTQHQEIHHHGSPRHSIHDSNTHPLGRSSNLPLPTRAQSMPSHSSSHSQHSRLTAHERDPLTEQNLFRLLSPYHNPSPEYRTTRDHSGDTSQNPGTGSV